MGANASDTVAAWSLNNARSSSPAKDQKMVQARDWMLENGFDPDAEPVTIRQGNLWYDHKGNLGMGQKPIPRAILIAELNHNPQYQAQAEKKAYLGSRRGAQSSLVLKQFWNLLFAMPQDGLYDISTAQIVEQGMKLARANRATEVDVELDHTGQPYMAHYRFADRSELFLSGAGASVE
jgi:hypothetical protein